MTVEQIREAVALARTHKQTHVQLVVARAGKVTRGVVRLNGQSGPVSDRERPVERVDERHVLAWFDVVSLRIWLQRQPVSRDAI